MSHNPHTSWNEFWALNNKSGQDGGCLPSGYAGIQAAQKKAWDSFAKTLPKRAKVLDLATGDGRVMAWLLKARRDLKLTGCDMAPKLPPPPRGTKQRSGVKMEALPFGDDQFSAVVSQFGFEYGNTKQTAAEAARVLRQGNRLTILTHRQDGPILAHNLKRREQIQWVIQDRNLPEIAKNSLKLRNTGFSIVPDVINQAPKEGAAKYGPQSAAWEIAEAIRQSLALGARDHPANVARLIDQIEYQAKNELGRIASLEAACATTAAANEFEADLYSAGFEATGSIALKDGAYPSPFADFRSYRLKA